MDTAKYVENFKKARDVLHKHNIHIQPNDGTVCMELMFNTYELINFLNTEGGSGLTRLRKLSVLLNQDGMGLVDYNASQSVNKWVSNNENLFTELPEEDMLRICSSDCGVYVNNYGKDPDDDMNSYCEAEYPKDEVERCKSYGDNMLWFWVGEY